MKASVGDVVVAAGSGHDHHTRTGTVMSVRGPDGGPPFMVRWSDTGHETLYFPDPATVVDHEDPSTAIQRPPASVLTTGRWTIDLYLAAGEAETTAHAVLHTSAGPDPLQAWGGALHPSEDKGVVEIGEEIATSRALHQLADLLGRTATTDLRPAHDVGP